MYEIYTYHNIELYHCKIQSKRSEKHDIFLKKIKTIKKLQSNF